MENLMISANAVLPMCLVMALGYGTRRLGWLRREEISTINKIAFRIFLPCLLYYNHVCFIIIYIAPICPARLTRC